MAATSLLGFGCRPRPTGRTRFSADMQPGPPRLRHALVSAIIGSMAARRFILLSCALVIGGCESSGLRVRTYTNAESSGGNTAAATTGGSVGTGGNIAGRATIGSGGAGGTSSSPATQPIDTPDAALGGRCDVCNSDARETGGPLSPADASDIPVGRDSAADARALGTDGSDSPPQIGGVGVRDTASEDDRSGVDDACRGSSLDTAGPADPADTRTTPHGVLSPTGSMNAERYMFSATLLADGRVLMAGGWISSASAELYDPTSGTFTSTGKGSCMTRPRERSSLAAT